MTTPASTYWVTSTRSMGKLLKKAHLLRWRPRPHAQRTENTPRVRPSGAASQLDLFEQPASSGASCQSIRSRPSALGGDPVAGFQLRRVHDLHVVERHLRLGVLGDEHGRR